MWSAIVLAKTRHKYNTNWVCSYKLLNVQFFTHHYKTHRIYHTVVMLFFKTLKEYEKKRKEPDMQHSAPSSSGSSQKEQTSNIFILNLLHINYIYMEQ